MILEMTMEQSWVNDVIIVGSAVTYREEIGYSFADANDQQALAELNAICCIVIETLANREILIETAAFWDALHQLPAALAVKLHSIPDSNLVKKILCESLESDNGYEGSSRVVHDIAAHDSAVLREIIVGQVEDVQQAVKKYAQDAFITKPEPKNLGNYQVHMMKR